MDYRNLHLIDIESFNDEQALEEINNITALIREADVLYHQNDDPVLIDSEYDFLRLYLEKLKNKFPESYEKADKINSVGHTPSKGFKKTRHSAPMLSLANGLNYLDIESFETQNRNFLGLNKNEQIVYTAEPKIDGLSLALRYESGALVHALTRGDGFFGENVTANAMTVTDIPLEIS